MGVKVVFKSGKSIDLKGATGFKTNQNETFKYQNGGEYKAPGYVIFFGKGKRPIHYKVASCKSIDKY